MSEMSVMGIMNSIIPISRFNKGEANRIFDEVEASGTNIVMKNNRPACILMSPGRYEALMEMLSDYVMQEEADSRMSHFNSNEILSPEEIMDLIGITEEDLNDVEAEIE